MKLPFNTSEEVWPHMKIFLLDLKLDTWAGKNIHIIRIKTLS